VAGPKWSDLSKRNQRLLIAAAAVETSLKAAALIDLKRRPASQVRGPKWAWVPALSILNSAGIAPITYFVWGRKRNS
jgi:hypothetical protein